MRKVHVERRINEVINRLNKTKQERKPDLRAEREERDRLADRFAVSHFDTSFTCRLERDDKKAITRALRKQEEDERKRKEEDAYQRSYDRIMNPSQMSSNKDQSGYDSDDFM